jgi:hypothetical protein
MPSILRYEFEELPAFIIQGFECGSLDGVAEISYSQDGEWSIAEIGVNGTKKSAYTHEQRYAALQAGTLLPNYDRKIMWLDRGSAVFSMLYDILENARANKISDAVSEQIQTDRDDAEFARADYRREQRAMA